MKKGKGKQIVTLLLACVMIFTPTVSQAATSTSFGSYPVYDADGKRTGFESIIIDDMTYYDIYGGEKNNSTTTASQVQFLMNALQSEPQRNGESIGSSALAYWADLAYDIFAAHGDYATRFDISKFGSGAKASDGYGDVAEMLAGPASLYYNRGSVAGIRTYTISGATGLQTTTSLSEIFPEANKLYSDAFNQMGKTISETFFVDGVNNGNGISVLNNDSSDPVLYSLAYFADPDNDGDTRINMFGLAFYDFNLQVLADDELEYITAAEGYDSIEDAANKHATGVTYKEGSTHDNTLNFYENGAKVAADVGMEFTQTNSMEVSNSFEQAKSFSFSQMVGSETKMGASFPAFSSFEQTFKAEFTTEEAISTAYTDTTSVTKENSSTVSAELSLPAQSAVEIESAAGTTDVVLDYDCPVAITYKVAIYSMSAYITTSKKNPGFYGANTVFGTAFGCDSDIGGTDAVSNLYNRAYLYWDTPSFDKSYGQTEGIISNNSSTLQQLDWSKILDGQIVAGDLEEPRANIVVERYLVSEDGDQATVSELIDSGIWEEAYVDYESNIEVEDFTLDDKSYKLYTGPVYDDTGTNLNADLRENEGVWYRTVLPRDESDYTIQFYFTLDETSPLSAVYKENTETPAEPEEATMTVEETEGAQSTEDEDESIISEESIESTEAAAEDAIPAAEPEELIEPAENTETEESEAVELYEAPATPNEDEEIIEDGDENDESALTIESTEVAESDEIPASVVEEDEDVNGFAEEDADQDESDELSTTSIRPLALDSAYDDVVWLITHTPMSSTGGSLAMEGKSTSSEIYGIEALYPLDFIKVTSGQKTFDMISGTTLNVDNIEIDGFNENDVSYYGFDPELGSWVLSDEDGNELEGSDTAVASLETDHATGETILTAEEEGTVYLKYVMDEKATKYTARYDDTPVTNEDLSSTAMVKINVAKGPFNGTVVADGTLVGYANETDDDYERVYINLDTCDTISATVYDETDKKISHPAITWESREDEDDGITIENNQLYFTEPGTYHIRAVYGYSTIDNSNTYSEWIEITALPEKVLEKLTIEDITDPATLSEIILGDGCETINLGWLAYSGIDQYGNDWTKLDNLKWYVDDEEVEANDAGSYLYTAAEAGTHVIYAKCTDPDGKYNVKSNELTLSVLSAARKLDSLQISDTTSPKTLAEVTYGKGKEKVDLSNLKITAVDQYGDTWTDLGSLKWYVDDKALSGSVYTVKNTSAGTHSIYAQCDGVKSNKLSISVKVPATSIKLNKKSLEIKDGKTKQLTATMTPSGTTDTVTWSSSNKKVATVSSNGTVTAVSAGTAIITAKTTSGQSATCQVHAVYKTNETFSKGSYKYIVKDSSTDGTGKVYMTGFVKGKSKTKLTVPDTVTINGTTYKVTAIANKAFKGNSKIKSFTSGKNLTTIGRSAFENCQSLKTVTIGNSVKKIDYKAFYDCYKLKNLTIGKNVNYMGAHCFCNDSKLKTITIKTTKLKKKNVKSPHVFINVNNATMKVPKSKYKDYKKLFTAREYGGKIKKKK